MCLAPGRRLFSWEQVNSSVWRHNPGAIEPQKISVSIRRFAFLEEPELPGNLQDQLNGASSFKEFAAILRKLAPHRVGETWAAGQRDTQPYWRQVNYQAATVDRFYQIGYLATALDEKERRSCIDFGRAIAQHIRTWPLPDRKRLWLEASFTSSLRYYSFNGSSENTRAYLYLNGMIDSYGAKVEQPQMSE